MPPSGRWAISRSRSPFSSRERCESRRARSRRNSPAPSARSRRRPYRRDAERLPEPVSRSAAFLLAARAGRGGPATPPPEKTIVEHTAINPNKAAHIGHLRNAALGDTLVRVLRFRGTPVEVQNYIDDTGVQVADIIVGFRELEHPTLDDVRRIADTTRFDYYCWDLYARVTEWYDEAKDASRSAPPRCTISKHGGNETAEIGAFIVDRIVRAHLKTMARLNIAYDLLTYEGDILRLKFWAHAFEILKAQGAVFLQTEGRLAGCWVMRIEEGERCRRRRLPTRRTTSREKVIVRSNGVVTYVGKDIANQFWKFGLLGRDFRYRLFAEQADGRRCGRRHRPTATPARRRSASAARIYNVIDSRQMYLQALLSQALRTLGHPREAENSIHFSYEMVALSHATARELGYATAGRRGSEKAVRRGVGAQRPGREDRRPARSPHGEGVRGSRKAQSGVLGRGVPARRVADRRRRHPLLHAEVLARQADRVRHRGGAELRGRNRPVPAVRCRARQQHLPQAAGTRGAVRAGRAGGARRTPRPTS